MFEFLEKAGRMGCSLSILAPFFGLKIIFKPNGLPRHRNIQSATTHGQTQD